LSYLTNSYRYAAAPHVIHQWFATGYGTTSPPSISTITNTNDAAAPDGAAAVGGWSRGNALSQSTGKLIIKFVGTVATLKDCAIGLCDYTTASGISSQNLALSNSKVFAFMSISEDEYVSPQAIYADREDFAPDDIFTIALSDTTLSYKRNDVEWVTYTIVAGDYSPFVTSADGNTGNFQFTD